MISNLKFRRLVRTLRIQKDMGYEGKSTLEILEIVKSQQAKIDVLVKALERYGRHEEDCQNYLFTDNRCTCHFDKVLDQIKSDL